MISAPLAPIKKQGTMVLPDDICGNADASITLRERMRE